MGHIIQAECSTKLQPGTAESRVRKEKKKTQKTEGKVLCTSGACEARNSRTFQFDFILLLIHARIITELVVILFLLIWWVQRDHCALRKRDARTYYYLQIRATYLNEEIP